MRIKKIIIAFVTAGVLIAGLGTAALAAGPGKKGHGHRLNIDQKVEKMSQHLELDEQQAAKIRTILVRSKEDLKALKAADGERADKRDEFRAIRQSARAEIDAVLTPAQLEKAEAHRAERMSKHKKMRRRKGARAMKGMKKRLNLSDEQVTEIKEIRKTARGEMKTIVEDDFGGDRKAASEAIKTRRAEMVADIEGVLTPEQASEFAEFRQKMLDARGERGKGHRHGKGKGGPKGE